ncbi:hypothetical protein H0H87_011471 [Tephrocybe sp. NHM501043]|nr:hypothetical protein H0H87_011471 [Tephrocybe sp. NHM501043]
MVAKMAQAAILAASIVYASVSGVNSKLQTVLQVAPTANPTASCIDSPTLEHMVACFDNYTVTGGVYTQKTYEEAQPTALERTTWLSTISSLLDIEEDCHSVELPDPLTNIYTVSQFQDPSGVSYCVFSEVSTNGTMYAKGWGLFVTPSTRAAAPRNIHLAAPHPGFDIGTPLQAGVLFKSAGAKSLLVAGRNRLAFKQPTTCVPSMKKSTYYVTDPAHNKEEPFYDATRTIYQWQIDHGGCDADSCAFIQFHGKANTTCRVDQIFISTGLGNNEPSKEWYLDEVPRPVKTLKAQLRSAFPNWNVTVPSDSACILTATKNVVGRFLNGVNDELVCTTNANLSSTAGMFVHIEQEYHSILPESFEAWSIALNNTFRTVDVY